MTAIAADKPSVKTAAAALTVRPAAAADAAALERLEQRVFSITNYPLSRRAFYYHIPRNLLLVAQTRDGVIAGYILLLTSRKTPKIYSLATSPDFRNMGIATMLLDQALKELAEHGCEQVTLEVRCDSGGAVSLYRRFGFEIVKTIAAFYRDGCDAYLMRRRLSNASK